MWFAWAMQLEAAHAISQFVYGHARLDEAQATAGSEKSDDWPSLKTETHQARRALLLAGVATGCPANFAWRGHRRTRGEYQPNEQTITLLRDRGMQLAAAFESAAEEVHALYRIREWGEDVNEIFNKKILSVHATATTSSRTPLS